MTRQTCELFTRAVMPTGMIPLRNESGRAAIPLSKQVLQYCAKVMIANFDEIRALFSSKFVENSSKIPWKFRTLDMRNFMEVGEIS